MIVADGAVREEQSWSTGNNRILGLFIFLKVVQCLVQEKRQFCEKCSKLIVNYKLNFL